MPPESEELDGGVFFAILTAEGTEGNAEGAN